MSTLVSLFTARVTLVSPACVRWSRQLICIPCHYLTWNLAHDLTTHAKGLSKVQFCLFSLCFVQEIGAYETKTVMRALYVGASAHNFSGFIRLKMVNGQSPNETVVLPVEVEVTNGELLSHDG